MRTVNHPKRVFLYFLSFWERYRLILLEGVFVTTFGLQLSGEWFLYTCLEWLLHRVFFFKLSDQTAVCEWREWTGNGLILWDPPMSSSFRGMISNLTNCGTSWPYKENDLIRPFTVTGFPRVRCPYQGKITQFVLWLSHVSVLFWRVILNLTNHTIWGPYKLKKDTPMNAVYMSFIKTMTPPILSFHSHSTCLRDFCRCTWILSQPIWNCTCIYLCV